MIWQSQKGSSSSSRIRGFRALGAIVVAGFISLAASVPTSGANAAVDDYVVLLRSTADAPDVAREERRRGNDVEDVFNSRVNGLVAKLDPSDVKRLRQDPDVAVVERDRPVRALAVRDSATTLWGLDRIDQRTRPGNGRITTATDGSGVTAYVIDTGIRSNHVQFEDRVAARGFSAFSDQYGWEDCQGHGTHVAGTVAGKDYGVAPKAELVAIRVLGCTGSGSTSGVIAGIDWAAADHPAGAPAVANLSLGGGFSSTMNLAIQRLFNDGVSVAVAAGNENSNACNVSPASAPEAITVGATTSTDARASFSNFGSCLDIFAPGTGILSATQVSTTSTASWNGTSMASPHVAGAAALLLSAEPGLSPAQVSTRLSDASTTGVVTSPGTGSLNRLLYVGSPSANPTPEPEPEPAPPPPTAPGNDAFANASTLVSLSGSTGTTGGATREPGEPSHGWGSARSIWYRWTAPSDGTLTLATQGSGYDTLLAAYSGSSLDSLTLRAANDDNGSGGLWSRVTFAVASGTTYSIAIDGYNGASGSTALAGNFSPGSVSPAPPSPPSLPPNDAFVDAITLSDLGGLDGTNSGATREASEPSHGWGSARSIWYRWTAPAPGRVTLNTQGSSFDTVLAAYVGSALGYLTQRAANDDVATGSTWSRVSFPVVAGTTYSIVIDGYNGSSGNTRLGGTFAPTPAPEAPTLSGPNEAGQLTFSGASAGQSYLCRIGANVEGTLRECETPFALPQDMTDGEYSYRLAVLDPVSGLRSAEATGTFTVEGAPAPPDGPVGVSVNGGALYTSDPEVTLNVAWPAGTRKILVANDGSFDGEEYPVEGEIPWTLVSSGAERLPKTVYLKFLGAGGVVLEKATDDIILDQTAPTVGFARLVGKSVRPLFRVRLSARDAGSGLDRIETSNRRRKPVVVTPSSSTRTVSGPNLTIRSARQPRWYRVSDRAGNWSRWAPIRPSAR